MDFKTLVERMHEASAVAGVDTMRKIEEAHARVALDLLGAPDGWPEGWVVSGNKAQLPRGGQSWTEACVHVTPFSEGGYYVSVESACLPSAEAAMEAGRCAVWAMEGRRIASTDDRPATIDREALAAALHDAYVADATIVWGERCEDVRQGYRREADTAIRLCAGADAGARIADLETQIHRLQDRLTSAENGREDFRKAYNAAIDDGNASVRRLTATANAAVERAEAAEATIRLWEEESVAIHEALQEVGAPLPTAKVEARIRGMKRQIGAHTAEATEQHVAEAIRAILDGKGYNATGMGDALYAAMRALKNRILESDIVIKDRDAATARAEKAEADCRNIADPLARLQARAEEAEVRAAKAEKALRLSADAAEAATTDEEDARRELYDARAENDRLRRALHIATQATAHMSTVAALLTGEADDA